LQSVKNLHSFKLSASVRDIQRISSVHDISKLQGFRNGDEIVILGEGTNTLFLQDFDGIVAVNELKGIQLEERESNYVIEVQSGENWHQFVKHCMKNGVFGFENLALIPGTVGAAPVQNIGAYGIEVERFLTSVEYVDLRTLQTHSLSKEQCQFGYRSSIFKKELYDNAFITKVTFSVPKYWQLVTSYKPLNELSNPNPEDIFKLVCDTRKSKLPDPELTGNAGSFFKNPVVQVERVNDLLTEYPDMPVYPVDATHSKFAAGWLMEQAGLRGLCIEGVCSHKNQALVLINQTGDASGESVQKFIELAVSKVQSKFSVALEPEVRLIGKNGVLNDLSEISR
jgi:UDP-N-acetylmuramate dehydrogenase